MALKSLVVWSKYYSITVANSQIIYYKSIILAVIPTLNNILCCLVVRVLLLKQDNAYIDILLNAGQLKLQLYKQASGKQTRGSLD